MIGRIVFDCSKGMAKEDYGWDPTQEPGFVAPVPTVDDYRSAIQALVDNTAREQQFNDGVTLASYVTSTVSTWAAQAAAFVAWRDNIWRYTYSELAKVQAAERNQPTVEAFLLELPAIIWP